MTPLILLDSQEHSLRIGKIRDALADTGAKAILINDNANIFYITGRVFAGQIYIPAEGPVIFFIRRPVGLSGDGVVYVRKPEQIAETIGLNMPEAIALELDITAYSTVQRLAAIFPGSQIINGSPVMRMARSVKTPAEINLMKISGEKQERVYRSIPRSYRPGMTDLELQVEIEKASRLEGCLGQFRISGDSMELYMANILVGDNADNPTPYDFAMGGAGLDPSLPVGCNGTVIRPGYSVMVDANGNYTGYMTDMTRTFAVTTVDTLAKKAHQVSIDICAAIARAGKPGTPAKELYHLAESMAKDAGLERYFMGHAQKAGFIGHGVGIEINEMPVLAPRSKDILCAGNAIAVEPKFVIPGVGAVGIENTYIVTESGMERITCAPEELISLEK